LAVTIRLRRTGAKKRPTFRFVATDSRMPRDGRFIEILGHYNPIEKPATLGVKEERVYHWLKQGATTSDTVNGLFKQIGLWKKWEMMKKGEDVSQVALAGQIKEKTKKKKRKAKEGETVAPAPAAPAAAPTPKPEAPPAPKPEAPAPKPEAPPAPKPEAPAPKPEAPAPKPEAPPAPKPEAPAPAPEAPPTETEDKEKKE
jgi:small subunit ribosomal protein S16